MMDITKTVQAAALALSVQDVGATVQVRGQDLEVGPDEPLIVLDVISSRPYGYDQTYTTTVQVGAYAGTPDEALDLLERTKDPLRAAGFTEGSTRLSPGTDPGWITDWRAG